MDVKKVAITGSTGGLGVEICDMLAKRGFDLVLVDRNPKKSRDNAERLKCSYPSISIETVSCDLTDISDVKRAAAELCEKKVDALVLNSGIYNVPVYKCGSGYNNVFQVNFISQYYLARKLAEISPELKKVIAMSSIALNYSKTDESDPDFSTRRSAAKIYGNSKRYLTFALFEHFKENGGAKLCVVHPGVTLTNMTNHYPKAINWLVRIGIKILFPSPKKALRSFVAALSDDCADGEWIGPAILGVWGKPKKNVLNGCSENERKYIGKVADRIFEETEKTRL